MKISKAKIRNAKLTLRIKYPTHCSINSQEVDILTRKLFRGFLKPTVSGKKSTLDYFGPVGISLWDRMKKPISKYDFCVLIAQIAYAAQRIQRNGLLWNKVIWDIRYVFINESTKEIQLIYLPLFGLESREMTLLRFLESIVNVTKPLGGDTGFALRFLYELRRMGGFFPEKIEDYLAVEDRSALNTVKMQHLGSSGFMTDKPRDYYNHYSAQRSAVSFRPKNNYEQQQHYEATGLLDDDATGLLQENSFERTGANCNAAGAVKWNGIGRQVMDYDETGLLQESVSGRPNAAGMIPNNRLDVNVSDYDETSLLQDNRAGYSQNNRYSAGGRQEGGQWGQQGDYDETSMLRDNHWKDQQQRNMGYGSLAERNVSYQQCYGGAAQQTYYPPIDKNASLQQGYGAGEETTVLDDNNVHYPSITRVLTQETIIINKPVFRIGKERSYVDYFVSNNSAVSRSHADIISRAGRYYVIDLNSKNRTYINDRMLPVHYETEINDGDKLKLGNEEFVFHI